MFFFVNKLSSTTEFWNSHMLLHISTHLLYVERVRKCNCIYACVQCGHNASLATSGGGLAGCIRVSWVHLLLHFHVVQHYPIATRSHKMHFNGRCKGGLTEHSMQWVLEHILWKLLPAAAEKSGESEPNIKVVDWTDDLWAETGQSYICRYADSSENSLKLHYCKQQLSHCFHIAIFGVVFIQISVTV